MTLHKNISRTPLEQLITSFFLITRTILLLRGAEENLMPYLPIREVPGGDIRLSAELLKVTERIVLMRVHPKLVCENGNVKKVFRVFRRVFKTRGRSDRCECFIE